MYTRYLAHYDRDYDLALYESKKFEESFFRSSKQKIEDERILYENWVNSNLPETDALSNQKDLFSSMQDASFLINLIKTVDKGAKFKSLPKPKQGAFNKIQNTNSIIQCLEYLNKKFNNKFKTIHYTDFVNCDRKKILSFLFLIKYSYESLSQANAYIGCSIGKEQRVTIESVDGEYTMTSSYCDDFKESGFETETESLTTDTLDSTGDIIDVTSKSNNFIETNYNIDFKKQDSFVDEIPDTKIDFSDNDEILIKKFKNCLKLENVEGDRLTRSIDENNKFNLIGEDSKVEIISVSQNEIYLESTMNKNAEVVEPSAPLNNDNSNEMLPVYLFESVQNDCDRVNQVSNQNEEFTTIAVTEVPNGFSNCLTKVQPDDNKNDGNLLINIHVETVVSDLHLLNTEISLTDENTKMNNSDDFSRGVDMNKEYLTEQNEYKNDVNQILDSKDDLLKVSNDNLFVNNESVDPDAMNVTNTSHSNEMKETFECFDGKEVLIIESSKNPLHSEIQFADRVEEPTIPEEYIQLVKQLSDDTEVKILENSKQSVEAEKQITEHQNNEELQIEKQDLQGQDMQLQLIEQTKQCDDLQTTDDHSERDVISEISDQSLNNELQIIEQDLQSVDEVKNIESVDTEVKSLEHEDERVEGVKSEEQSKNIENVVNIEPNEVALETEHAGVAKKEDNDENELENKRNENSMIMTNGYVESESVESVTFLILNNQRAVEMFEQKVIDNFIEHLNHQELETFDERSIIQQESCSMNEKEVMQNDLKTENIISSVENFKSENVEFNPILSNNPPDELFIQDKIEEEMHEIKKDVESTSTVSTTNDQGNQSTVIMATNCVQLNACKDTGNAEMSIKLNLDEATIHEPQKPEESSRQLNESSSTLTNGVKKLNKKKSKREKYLSTNSFSNELKIITNGDDETDKFNKILVQSDRNEKETNKQKNNESSSSANAKLITNTAEELHKHISYAEVILQNPAEISKKIDKVSCEPNKQEVKNNVEKLHEFSEGKSAKLNVIGQAATNIDSKNKPVNQIKSKSNTNGHAPAVVNKQLKTVNNHVEPVQELNSNKLNKTKNSQVDHLLSKKNSEQSMNEMKSRSDSNASSKIETSSQNDQKKSKKSKKVTFVKDKNQIASKISNSLQEVELTSLTKFKNSLVKVCEKLKSIPAQTDSWNYRVFIFFIVMSSLILVISFNNV